MEHFKEVPDVNRLIISPLYLREGLEFAKNQGYNDILISTDDIGISGVSCKHTLNFRVRLYNRTMQFKSTKCFTALKKIGTLD